LSKVHCLFLFGSILVIIHTTSVSYAYAYLDPGTGTIILQAIFGVLIGVGITLKIYWYKIKEKISRVSKNK